MVNYKGFIFFDSYEFENQTIFMYEQLVGRFNLKAGCSNYFDREGFTILFGSENEKIFQNEGFYFLDVKIAFPPFALTYDCTICWKINEESEYDFCWTSNFPNDELADYIEKNPCKE